MDYRSKVMAYADVLQLFTEEGKVLIDLLQDKQNLYNQEPELQEFWSEVLGRMMRNCYYQEIREMSILERKYNHVVESAPDTISLVKSPNLLAWIKLLPNFSQHLGDLAEYQYQNMILEKASDQQAMDACMYSLGFLNYAIADGKSMSELFKYIPLTTWSLDALLITKQFHTAFEDFCKVSFFPIMRAHKYAVDTFIELVNNEEKYLAEEKSKKSELNRKSNIFDRYYVAEEIELPVPPQPNEGEQDPYIWGISAVLEEYFKNRRLVGERIDTEKRNWRLAPMSHLERLHIHADMLGVSNEYQPVMSPKLLKEAEERIYIHEKVYSERNLIESSVLPLENIIQESVDFESKLMFTDRYSAMLEVFEENIRDMLSLGLITGVSATKAVERMKNRGELHGIYSRVGKLE